jgi:hypothetical protein
MTLTPTNRSTIGAGTTEFLDIQSGPVAYRTCGAGSLELLAQCPDDIRQACRFLAPQLTGGGRVAAMDMRGHGHSSASWDSYTRP